MNSQQPTQPPIWKIFLIFLRLGLTSFGGPVAHIGFFRDEFVKRRHWLNEHAYADLVALCQCLPGPTSSQIGIALGLAKGGYPGALAAWSGFTLPSAVLLILLATRLNPTSHSISIGLLHGLEIVAAAVVTQAVWGMGRTLCPSITHIVLMLTATAISLVHPSVATQLMLIISASLIGWQHLRFTSDIHHSPLGIKTSRHVAIAFLGLWVALLIGLPILADADQSQALVYLSSFYRAGALVFGGGHVVLPLLQEAVVPQGYVSNEVFMAGYGAAQAVPGPLFSFAAFLGASMTSHPSGWSGGLLCLAAIFLPSFLLVVGALPFWEFIRHSRSIQSALSGINAAVVGILLAALITPIGTTAIQGAGDIFFWLIALTMVCYLKWPTWLAVAVFAFIGWMWL